MTFPWVIYTGAADTKGYPAVVAALHDDEYFQNPQRDDQGQLMIPIFVFASPENGGGYQLTAAWRDVTQEEHKQFTKGV